MVVLAAVLGSIFLVIALRFVPPPTTAFMAARWIEAKRRAEPGFRIDYRWQPLARISPQLSLAVIAAEDQTFPQHQGFDFASIESVLRARAVGGRGRGASTITQQVAKNLFLWSGRSWLRKGLEAWFTVLIETLWPKSRILEVYVNIAEFGNGIYGAEAAAQRFLGRPASALTVADAARMAAVLPNPRIFRVESPSRYMRDRARWIERQMVQLGPAHLDPVLAGQ